MKRAVAEKNFSSTARLRAPDTTKHNSISANRPKFNLPTLKSKTNSKNFNFTVKPESAVVIQPNKRQVVVQASTADYNDQHDFHKREIDTATSNECDPQTNAYSSSVRQTFGNENNTQTNQSIKQANSVKIFNEENISVRELILEQENYESQGQLISMKKGGSTKLGKHINSKSNGGQSCFHSTGMTNDELYDAFGKSLAQDNVNDYDYFTSSIINHQHNYVIDARFAAVLDILDLNCIRSILHEQLIVNFNDLILLKNEDFLELGLPLSARNRLSRFCEEYMTIAHNYDIDEILNLFKNCRKLVMDDIAFEKHFRNRNSTAKVETNAPEASRFIGENKENNNEVNYQNQNLEKQEEIIQSSCNQNMQSESEYIKSQDSKHNKYASSPLISECKKSKTKEKSENISKINYGSKLNPYSSQTSTSKTKSNESAMQDEINSYLKQYSELKTKNLGLNTKLKDILCKSSKTFVNPALDSKTQVMTPINHSINFQNSKMLESHNEGLEEENHRNLDAELSRIVHTPSTRKINLKQNSFNRDNEDLTIEHEIGLQNKVYSKKQASKPGATKECRDEDVDKELVERKLEKLYSIWSEKQKLHNSINEKAMVLAKKQKLIQRLESIDNLEEFENTKLLLEELNIVED